jgi:hypothetical protein
MRWRLGMAIGIAFAASCAPRPRPPAPALPAPPPIADTRGTPVIGSAAPSIASAPTPATTMEPPVTPLPVFPLAPPATMAEGVAAVVWVLDRKATDGVRSIWIEPEGDGAKIVAERSGMVFVGRRDLWRIAHRTVKLEGRPCEIAFFEGQCPAHPEIDEPFLESLRTGRGTTPPWRNAVRSTELGCDHSTDVTIEGTVGTIAFARIWTSAIDCGSSCAIHSGDFVAFDVDTGKPVDVAFPKMIEQRLREHVRRTVPAEELVACDDLPGRRVTAAYSEGGLLEGIYELGTSQGGLCGGAPMCFNPTFRIAVPPVELAPWTKLPPWVATMLAKTKSQHAVMIKADRAREARTEFSRALPPTK